MKPVKAYKLVQLPKPLLFQDKIEKRQHSETGEKLPKSQRLRNHHLSIKNKIPNVRLVP